MSWVKLCKCQYFQENPLWNQGEENYPEKFVTSCLIWVFSHFWLFVVRVLQAERLTEGYYNSVCSTVSHTIILQPQATKKQEQHMDLHDALASFISHVCREDLLLQMQCRTVSASELWAGISAWAVSAHSKFASGSWRQAPLCSTCMSAT